MPKGRTRRPAAPTNLTFNAFLPYPVGTFFPEPGSEKLAHALEAAYLQLNADPKFGLSTEIGHSLLDDLKVVASEYYIARSNYDADQLPMVKANARAVAKKVADVIARIDNATMRTAIGREHGKISLAGYQSTVEGLRLIERASLRVLDVPAPRRGPRERKHIGRAVRALARLWQRHSGGEFGKNWTLQGDQFISPGPEFVYRMAKAMDKDLTSVDIQTAIKGLQQEHLQAED